jgi:hypothetical protein
VVVAAFRDVQVAGVFDLTFIRLVCTHLVMRLAMWLWKSVVKPALETRSLRVRRDQKFLPPFRMLYA